VGDAHAITVAAGDRDQSRSGEKERDDIFSAALREDSSPARSTVWRRGATVLLGRRIPATVAGKLAARRGHALALVYHRVRPQPVRAYEVVPCVPVEQFRGHVETLLAIGDIVPLDDVVMAHGSARPRFALTFDDDYATHVSHVLPVLVGLGAPATFFLSGRALHGLGPYWWEVLEARMRHDGPEKVARALDVPRPEPAAIAAACEEDPERQRRLEADGADTGDQLRPSEIAALAAAGMTIGFHTVRHPVLPRLASPDRHRALTEGRTQLQDLTGQRLSTLAYPHGRTDAVTAADARATGYESAWTGAGGAVGRRSDRWRLGRWEAGAIGTDVLRARALARLLRPIPADG
jgi:peptidoglycan/xylan/chitin deacetylase (PgdA/CDA1 family)